MLQELTGTRAAYLLDEAGATIGKLPVREMFGALRELPAAALVFDGEIDQKLLNLCAQRGVKWVIGMRTSARRIPEGVIALILSDLE